MDAKGAAKLAFETEIVAEYGPWVVGIDEVGRGCLAGPVVAGSVILDYEALRDLTPGEADLIRDSKTLSEKQRQRIAPIIQRISRSFSVAFASAREIEQKGIVGATFLAMKRCLKAHPTIGMILVDGKFTIPKIPYPQLALIKGDGKTFAIAAASILAKEARDTFMRDQARKYPHWDFASNVGYGTPQHLMSLKAHGICPLHRGNFSPVAEA